MSRPIAPKRWTTLIVAGTAAGFTQFAPVSAATDLPAAVPTGNVAPMLIQTAGEGGEAGESGAIANATPEAAYITRLGLVEGHLIAARALYARGMTDDAVGLSGHPEAEMMDEVRESLAAHNATDFSDELENVGTVMAEGKSTADVDAALETLHDAIAAAAEAGNPSDKARFASMTALTRAAALTYSEVTEGGTVTDPYGYHEAYGFLKVAQAMATELAASDDAALAEAANRANAALSPAIAEYGEMSGESLTVGDASVLHGAAAKVELAGLRIN